MASLFVNHFLADQDRHQLDLYGVVEELSAEEKTDMKIKCLIPTVFNVCVLFFVPFPIVCITSVLDLFTVVPNAVDWMRGKNALTDALDAYKTDSKFKEDVEKKNRLGSEVRLETLVDFHKTWRLKKK